MTPHSGMWIGLLLVAALDASVLTTEAPMAALRKRVRPVRLDHDRPANLGCGPIPLPRDPFPMHDPRVGYMLLRPGATIRLKDAEPPRSKPRKHLSAPSPAKPSP